MNGRDNIDTIKVLYYHMRGREPDMVRDTLLGESTDFSGSEHRIDIALSPGDYKLYTVGIDLAGNMSRPSRVTEFKMVAGKGK